MQRFLKRTYLTDSRYVGQFLLVIILMGSAYPLAAQQPDKRIDAIRRYAKQVEMEIAESESIEEGTGIYLNELVVNKGNKQWPAVGIYRDVYKFYYTFGDREKNPYPDRLLKITLVTRMSNREETGEFLFNAAGQLIFYLATSDESPRVETRYYFASQRLIRRIIGTRVVDVNSRESLARTRAIIKEAQDLKTVFVKSLGN